MRSGNIIAQYGEKIILFPIPNDPLFSALFNVTYLDGDGDSTTTVNSDPSGVYKVIINVLTPWTPMPISNSGCHFARNVNEDFYLAYCCDPVGERDNHSIVLQYIVLSEGHSS